jgi:UDP-glucose 4-epimerase
MRILVTGGAGFIGSHVVEHLLALGHDVVALDNLSTGRRENVPQGARLIECDLRNRDAVFQVLRDVRPEAVSHQAAQASVVVSVRDPKLDAEVNVIGGLNLLDACVEVGALRFVFASTGGAIYGEVPPGKRAAEDTVPAPISPYAIHKLAFEQLLAVYETHRGLTPTILRYANVYGPRQDPHGEAGVIAIFLDAALAGKTLRVNGLKRAGDGGCVRDYVFVADVARMNVLALTGELSERVANVGTGIPTTTEELARAMAKVTGREDVAIENADPRPGDVGISLLDPTRPARYLGSLTPLPSGLEATRAWAASR